jgi:hypothetical protein
MSLGRLGGSVSPHHLLRSRDGFRRHTNGNSTALGRAQPVCIEMPGWEKSTGEAPIVRRLAAERATLFAEDLRISAE